MSFVISEKDKTILRKLALKVAEIANNPIQEKKRILWKDHNMLKDTRPVIFCDPENGWSEIITQDMIECEGELARDWEYSLRKEIFWGECMGDDRVVEPYFNIPYIYTETDWGMHANIIGGENKGAYTWDAPLKDYDDMYKLHFPQIFIDYEKTNELLNAALEVFDGVLNVRLKMSWWWTLGLTQVLVYLRGLEQIMYDMYDNPDELKSLMAFLRDGHIKRLDFLQNNHLLFLNNDSTYVGSGGFGNTDELPQDDFNGNVRTLDMWGFAESQETTNISPDMFEEFVFQYQLPLLERFGLNCYGCCEPLDKRWNIVKKVPRLRRVSVSPWADLEYMAKELGDKYIYSMKPNPADLAMPTINEERIRLKLREALQITKGCHVEIIMKDNNTIGHNPQNVIRWCKIAREESEKI